MATSTPIPGTTIGSTPIPTAAFNANPTQTATYQAQAANSSLVPGAIFGIGNTQLTLANGMTAGVGFDNPNPSGPNSLNTYSNPPLPLISQTGAAVNPYGGDPRWPIQRVGVMRNLPTSLGGSAFGTSGTDVSYLYFIYNPNQIVAAFSTNLNSIPPMYLYASGGQTGSVGQSAAAPNQITSNATSVPNLTNSQQISWSLIFDRTYDMMYDTNPDENRGVLKDTAALYALMGTFDNSGAVPVSLPVQVVFAQTKSGQLWGLTGYISSVNITYGIFRHNMIPSRCEIDLTMTCTYVAPQALANSGGTPGANAAAAALSTNGPPVNVTNPSNQSIGP